MNQGDYIKCLNKIQHDTMQEFASQSRQIAVLENEMKHAVQGIEQLSEATSELRNMLEALNVDVKELTRADKQRKAVKGFVFKNWNTLLFVLGALTFVSYEKYKPFLYAVFGC